MPPLRVQSHAKLNWFLRVLDRRSDGFHDLETVFETLEIADTLDFDSLSVDECRISGFPADVPADQNLITRAWQLLREEYPGRVGGMSVAAEKVLPRGGGLGGGSSNAAAALVALDRIYRLQIPRERLVALGARLGSDVAFFVLGGCARATGRGEILESLPAPGDFQVMLLFPDEPVPTGAAYARLSGMEKPDPVATLQEVADAVASGDAQRLAPVIHNDFELVVAGTPWWRMCRDSLLSAGCLRVFLCGSGSTVAGLVDKSASIEDISRRVHESCPYPGYHTTARALNLIR